jgi:hypothetical protein
LVQAGGRFRCGLCSTDEPHHAPGIAPISKPGDPQGIVFGTAQQLEWAWVLNGVWLPHHRLELECDLIGSHLLTTGIVPPAQFIG